MQMNKNIIPAVIGLTILFTAPAVAAPLTNIQWFQNMTSSNELTSSYNKVIPVSEKKVNPIFTTVSESSLTNDEIAFVEKVKQTKGVHVQGDLYVIARGYAPNPGYGIEITGEKIRSGQAYVYVKLTNPQPGKMYVQMITYPYIVGKVKVPAQTTLTFIDTDTGKPLFE